MTPHTKSPLLISLALILLILTAGCLDDSSSTLPPCCDGTCDGVKTSVITVEYYSLFVSHTRNYVKDSDGLLYDWDTNTLHQYDPYDNHNVTFSYEMVNGHRHITGIIEDHDAKQEFECVKKYCGCDE